MSLLNETEREELARLRQEVAELSNYNDVLLSSIYNLSGDLLKRRRYSPASPAVPNKRVKPEYFPLAGTSISQLQSKSFSFSKEPKEKEDIGLPNEIMLHLFKYLTREDLDRCTLVCKRWQKLITSHQTTLSRRRIRVFKIVETGPHLLMFSCSNAQQSIKYHLDTTATQQIEQDIIHNITKLLTYSKVRRIVFCGFHLTDVIIHDLISIFKKADVIFYRLEMIGMSLRNLSAETFQKFIGEQINAEQYFLDGMIDADADHFGSKFFERPAIKKAEDLTIYDVSSVVDEDVFLDVADDVLLDFIFGKNTDATDRATLYLDSPAISSSFINNALIRFTQETSLKNAVPHSELAHCRSQTIHNNRNIRSEYDVHCQCEYSAYNPITKSVLEAKISRTPDDDEFVHCTLSITN